MQDVKTKGPTAHITTPLGQLILNQLACREMRQLVLVVAVRKSLLPSDRIKGDLSMMVRTALRQLVSSRVVLESDGVFSLRVPSQNLPN